MRVLGLTNAEEFSFCVYIRASIPGVTYGTANGLQYRAGAPKQRYQTTTKHELTASMVRGMGQAYRRLPSSRGFLTMSKRVLVERGRSLVPPMVTNMHGSRLILL